MISMRSRSGRADRLGDVRRGDEEHLRQVVRNLEVVVAELPVLFRVKHFEQRRGRIAAEVGADLVDLVEHDHRVARPAVRIDWMIRPGSAPI